MIAEITDETAMINQAFPKIALLEHTSGQRQQTGVMSVIQIYL